jgi:hypothetical protein
MTAVIAMIMVAMSYANGMLNSQMANNEFTSNQQFMATTGQQMDAVAWNLGSTQTVTYSTHFGFLSFNASALNYSFAVYSSSSGWVNFTAPATGLLLYNMPLSYVSLGSNYFERVPVNANSSFLQQGASVPVNQVLCEEKLSSNSSCYTRIALVPTIRMFNSTIMGTPSTSYYKFYLPYLCQFSTTHSSSPSVTLTGENVTEITTSGVTKIIVTAIPSISAGFNSSFFNFANNSVTLNIPSSVAEFYFGEVTTTEGCS